MSEENETKWALAICNVYGESNTKAQMKYMFKHLLIIPAIEALTREIHSTDCVD